MSETAQPTFAGMTVVQLREALQVLLQTRLSGTLNVRYSDGTSITYRSDAELEAQVRYLERLIAQLDPAPVTDRLTQPIRAFRLRPWNGYR